MGVYECAVCWCEELEVFTCERCGLWYGNWNSGFCKSCLLEKGAYCDRCEQWCCPTCKKESKEKHKCCGMIICGTANVSNVKDKEEMKHNATWHKREYNKFLTDVNDESYACIWEHKTKTLECGHPGCNFHNDGCYTCQQNAAAADQELKIQADKKLLEEMMPRVQSAALRKTLESWKEDPHNKKGEGVQEERDRYYKAVNACTCTARYLAF